MKNKLTLILALVATIVLTTASTCSMSECARRAAIYQQYIKLFESGAVLDPEQIERAKLAAAFLTISCGWLPEEEVVVVGLEGGVRSVSKGPKHDVNGVPVVRPPSLAK